MSMEGKSEVEVEKQSNFCFDGQEWVLGLDHDKKLSSILVPDKDGYFLDPVRQIVPGRQNGGKPNVFWATLKETNTKVLIKPLFGSWCHFTDEDSRKPVAAYLDSIKPKFGIQAMGTKYVYLKSQIKLKQDDESDFHWTKEKTWIYNFEEERKEQKEEIGYLIIQYSGFNIPFKNFHPNANFSKFSKEEKLKLLKVVLWRTIFSSDPNSLNLLVKQSGQKVEYLAIDDENYAIERNIDGIQTLVKRKFGNKFYEHIWNLESVKSIVESWQDTFYKIKLPHSIFFTLKKFLSCNPQK